MARDPIRVMIVDDSVVIRRAVTDALSKDQEVCVVGSAQNGKIALEKIPSLNPEVLILDIEMPLLDGFGVLRALRLDLKKIHVIMFSTLTQRGEEKTMKALTLGAHDYVPKPTTTKGIGYHEVTKLIGDELIPKIKQFRPAAPVAPSRPARSAAPGSRPSVAPSRPARPAAPGSSSLSQKKALAGILNVVAIGISTGGPNALISCLPKLKKGFPVPILIVQHMPPRFTKLLADRLNVISEITVKEGEEGEVVVPGVAYIAPGDYHMVVRKQGDARVLVLNQRPRENSCRPSADVLFRSVKEVYGRHALGVIMTGMGQDGLEGLRVMSGNGSPVVAQDEESSVVWGMPGAVVNEGLADKVVSLDQIAETIASCFSGVFV